MPYLSLCSVEHLIYPNNLNNNAVLVTIIMMLFVPLAQCCPLWFQSVPLSISSVPGGAVNITLNMTAAAHVNRWSQINTFLIHNVSMEMYCVNSPFTS